MKKETYLKIRKDFLEQYSKLKKKNELGYTSLQEFKIRNFKKFLFLFSYDFLGCYYTNTVSSISKNKFKVKNKVADKIKIVHKKSIFDKYPEQFDRALEYYSR